MTPAEVSLKLAEENARVALEHLRMAASFARDMDVYARILEARGDIQDGLRNVQRAQQAIACPDKDAKPIPRPLAECDALKVESGKGNL